MRHRRRGRKLGRSPKHRRAMLRNMACSLILTEDFYEEGDPLKPKVPGRIVTTLPKAKEVRRLVERCVRMACRAVEIEEQAQAHATEAERGTEAWQSWREGDGWQKWNQAIAPAVAIRRRLVALLGGNRQAKQAVQVLVEEIAPRYLDRPGGYTRILRLARPRLGDAGTRAILEFVGVRDRQAREAIAPAFDTEPEPEPEPAEDQPSERETAEVAAASETENGGSAGSEEEKPNE